MSTEAGTGVKRREFLKILGATGATTAVVGCSSEKVGKLIPYVASPDNTVPGVSQYYATTCRECATVITDCGELHVGRRNVRPTDALTHRMRYGCHARRPQACAGEAGAG